MALTDLLLTTRYLHSVGGLVVFHLRLPAKQIRVMAPIDLPLLMAAWKLAPAIGNDTVYGLQGHGHRSSINPHRVGRRNQGLRRV